MVGFGCASKARVCDRSSFGGSLAKQAWKDGPGPGEKAVEKQCAVMGSGRENSSELYTRGIEGLGCYRGRTDRGQARTGGVCNWSWR